jgi:spermidine synthase
VRRRPDPPRATSRESRRVFVRHGPHGLELRVDGTFASSLREGRLSAGPVWDAIAASVLALPPHRRRSALILGLGGGSIVRLLLAIAPKMSIVGVEKDEEVVRVARRQLGLGALGVEVVLGDALAVLASERRHFDLIVEDTFVGPSRGIRKPDGFPAPGLDLASRRLTPSGVLAVNTIHEGPDVARVLAGLLPELRCASVQGYWNRIYVAGRSLPSASEWRGRVRGRPELAASSRSFSFRQLAGRHR